MKKEHVLHILESYPHVRDRIDFLWSNKDALNNYLSTLLMDERRDSRKGFPEPVASMIYELFTETMEPTHGFVDTAWLVDTSHKAKLPRNW